MYIYIYAYVRIHTYTHTKVPKHRCNDLPSHVGKTAVHKETLLAASAVCVALCVSVYFIFFNFTVKRRHYSWRV